MKFIFAICLSFVVVFFDNCSTCSCKQVTCPAFRDTGFKQWFPYNAGDQMIFQNNSESDTFSVFVDPSTTFDVSQGCFGANGSCFTSCYVYSSELYSSYNRKLRVLMYGPSPKNISLDLYQFNCQATDVVDTGLILMDSTSHSSYYPSMDIGGKTFSNVQLITKDTAAGYKMAGPYRIFLAKNVGIIAYENYPDLRLWIKQ